MFWSSQLTASLVDKLKPFTFLRFLVEPKGSPDARVGTRSLDIRRLDAVLGRAAGELLARAGQHDVIDAALVLLANDGDRIITSDPGDLARLARAADIEIELVRP